MFLDKPSNFVLLTALSLKTSLKVSRVNSFQSFEVILSNSGCGLNNGSSLGLENLFQGHTS